MQGSSWLTTSLPLRAVKIELQVALKVERGGPTPVDPHALTTTRCGSTVVADAECITVTADRDGVNMFTMRKSPAPRRR
jgi:hypothetical protein